MDNYLHQTRKGNKPLIERRRRERMNKSLQHLKTLVLQATNKQDIKKLEKADILDMTVRYIEDIQQNHTQDNKSLQMSRDSFIQGYTTCVNEISTVLRMQSIGDDVTCGLSNHLSARLFSMTTRFSHNRSHGPSVSTTQPSSSASSMSCDRPVTSTPNTTMETSLHRFSPIHITNTPYCTSPRDHCSSPESLNADISIDSGISSTSTDSSVWRPW